MRLPIMPCGELSASKSCTANSEKSRGTCKRKYTVIKRTVCRVHGRLVGKAEARSTGIHGALPMRGVS